MYIDDTAALHKVCYIHVIMQGELQLFMIS